MDKKCSNCGTDMESVGDMKFRVGGYSGAAAMFLSGWNELAETTQTFSLYRCPNCGKVDFYEPQESEEPKRKHLL